MEVGGAATSWVEALRALTPKAESFNVALTVPSQIVLRECVTPIPATHTILVELKAGEKVSHTLAFRVF